MKTTVDFLRTTFLVFSFIFFWNASGAQFYCGWEYLTEETDTSQSIPESTINLGQEIICDSLIEYAPDEVYPEHRPELTIRLAIHLYNDGIDGFFANDSANIFTHCDSIIQTINSHLKDLDTLSPFPLNGDTYLGKDARLSFEVSRIYFITDSNVFNSPVDDTSTTNDLTQFQSYILSNHYNSLSQSDKDTLLHVFVGENCFAGTNLLNAGISMQSKGVIVHNWFPRYDANVVSSAQWRLLLHEIGHSLTLAHTFSDIDINGDTTTNYSCPFESNIGHPLKGETNSFMDYSPSNYKGISRCQLGKIHHHVLSTWQIQDMLVPNHCKETDEFLDVEAVGLNDTIVWKSARWMNSNIRVKEGTILVIKCLVGMPKNSKITVEPGGQLIIDGGIVTNVCDQTWAGIEVHGDHSKGQNSSDQGVVIVINGGRIAWAEIGINASRVNNGYDDFSKTGGIIQMIGSEISNCKKSIGFMPYLVDYSLSFFENVTFRRSWHYSNRFNGLRQNHVGIWGVSGIEFIGCSFIEQDPFLVGESEKIGSGITAYNSSFKILPICSRDTLGFCDTSLPFFKPTTFTNLYRGINVSNSVERQYLDIQYCEFKNVQKGITLKGAAFPRVILNKFTFDNGFYRDLGDSVKVYHATHGIYLIGSNGYQVEENIFNFDPAGDFTYCIPNGILIHNGDDDDEVIRRNSFENLFFSSSAIGLNGNSHTITTGLQFLCNKYDSCVSDIGLFKGDLFTNQFLGTNVNQDREPYLRNIQGFCTPNPLPHFPANNEFSTEPAILLGPSGSHLFSIDKPQSDSSSGIKYYHYSSVKMKPDAGKVSLRYKTENCIPSGHSGTIDIESCPIEVFGTVDTQKFQNDYIWLTGKIVQFETQIYEIFEEVDYYDSLLSATNQSNIDEVYSIIAQDSIVSPSVLESAVSNYYASSDLEGLKTALINHSGLEESVIDSLVIAQLPYSQSDIDDILNAQDQISPYEGKLNKLAVFRSTRSQLTNQLIRKYIDIGIPLGAIRFLVTDTMRETQLKVLELSMPWGAKDSLIQRANYCLTKDWIDSSNWQYYYFAKNDTTFFSNSSLPHLDSINLIQLALNESRSIGNTIALFELVFSEEYLESYPEGFSTEKKEYFRRDPWENIYITPSVDALVFPNPSSKEINVWWCDTELNYPTVSMFNSIGKLVFVTNDLTESCRMRIDLSNFQSGPYILQISENGTLYEKKVIVR